jgi:hypothetical protein
MKTRSPIAGAEDVDLEVPLRRPGMQPNYRP